MVCGQWSVVIARNARFTLAELLVTMSVLVLLVLLFTQLLNSAATTMTLGNKRMDADSQARQLLDRMAIDFDQMLKRTDVSYYVKTKETHKLVMTKSRFLVLCLVITARQVITATLH